jgi:Transcriptional regulators
MSLSEIDRRIINALQDGIPLCEHPYGEAAERIGLTEQKLRARLIALRDSGVITRIGPMFRAERMGGGVTLAAMRIPREDFERVARLVNAYDEVAHNYERDHEFNMWFVVASEDPDRVEQVLREIERKSGYPVYDMPRLDEFYVGLRFEV